MFVESVQNPATAGATLAFTLKVFKDSAKTLSLFTGTTPAVTIAAQSKLNCLMFQPKTRRRVLQYGDIGPFRVDVDITSALTKRTGSMTVSNNQFLNNFLAI